MKFEKITKVMLPFDMRAADPKKNYGIHGLDIWYILKGPEGAVQYAVTIQVNPESVARERGEVTYSYNGGSIYRGFDVGYHSPKPMYEDQGQMDCEHIEGGKCYYDGSSLRSDDWTKIIFETTGQHPEDVLWPMLEEEYKLRFQTGESEDKSR
jgi:hypothetical protein